MVIPVADTRSEQQKALDERIVAEPPLPAPDLPAGAKGRPLEEMLHRSKKPVAVVGVVENGLVRPLDPLVKLAERSRVIIVAQEPV